MDRATDIADFPIDVFIPVYNDARYIARAVNSALAQKDVDLRVIVSDNASTDGTSEILQDLAKQDDRVYVSRNVENIGMMGNIRRFADLVERPFYMFLCSDDYLCSDTALSEALNLIRQNPSIVSVYCDLDFVDQDGRHILYNRFDRPAVFKAEDAMRRSLITTRNRFGIPLLHRTELSKEHPYNTPIAYACDLWHSYKVGQNGDCGHIPKAYIANSYTGSNLTRDLMGNALSEFRSLAEMENIRLSFTERLRQRLNFYRTLISKLLFFQVLLPVKQKLSRST